MPRMVQYASLLQSFTTSGTPLTVFAHHPSLRRRGKPRGNARGARPFRRFRKVRPSSSSLEAVVMVAVFLMQVSMPPIKTLGSVPEPSASECVCRVAPGGVVVPLEINETRFPSRGPKGLVHACSVLCIGLPCLKK